MLADEGTMDGWGENASNECEQKLVKKPNAGIVGGRIPLRHIGWWGEGIGGERLEDGHEHIKCGPLVLVYQGATRVRGT